MKPRIGIAILLAAAAANAQEVFYARDFLYTREFKMGLDLSPDTFPLASAPGGIYLGGAFMYPPFGDPQGFLRKYDASGGEIWTAQIGPANAYPTQIAADAASVYAAGSIGLGRADFFLNKYDAAGNLLWSRQARISEGGYHVVTGLAVDASGIYIAVWSGFNQGLLRKYSPAGDELWSRTPAAFNTGGVAVEPSGVYVFVWTDGVTAIVRKYSASGNELWTRAIDAGKSCQCVPPQWPLAADTTGVYVASATMSKLDPSGNLVWTHPFDPFPGGSFRIGAATLDENSLYVSGVTERELPGQCKAGFGDAFVRSSRPLLLGGRESGRRDLFSNCGAQS